MTLEAARIERVVLHRIGIPFRTPFVSGHGTETHKHATIVEVLAEGVTGWGECAALENPTYTYEYADGAFFVLRDLLAPQLIDQRPALVVGHPMAKAAIEAAILDVHLRMTSLSLAAYLGVTRSMVPAGVAVGIAGGPDELVEAVAVRVAEGYRRVKLKIGPGRDIEWVAAVRRAFPELELHVDANGAYSLATAPTLRRLDALGLALIEQPFDIDDLEGHAALAAMIETPICLDESITSARACERALDMGACSVVNLKQARVGGLAEALRIHGICRGRGIGLWCGGMLETGVGRALNLALAALPGFTLTGDLSATSRYFTRDITAPTELVDGCLAVPVGAGIGVEVDREFLATCTIGTATIVPSGRPG